MSNLWLPSASNFARSLQCPGSVVLPKERRGGEPPLEMRKGSYLHLLLERLLVPRDVQIPRLVALAKSLPFDEVFSLDEACSKITRDDILRGGVLVGAEVALAYDPATDSARLLGESIGREYIQHGWSPSMEIPGSADVILRTGRSSLIVGDFKTAHYDNQVSDSWQPQLDVLALMAARFYGFDSVSTVICLVFDDGRIKWTQLTHLDALDLDVIAATIREAVQRWHHAADLVSQNQSPNTKPGLWCDRCASKPLCPSWSMMARQMASGELGLSPELIASLTPEEAGLVWERLKTAEEILKTVKEQLQRYASRVPLVLPDGMRLRRQECERDNLNDKAAMEYLTVNYGVETANQCAKWKISKTELHRVLGHEEAKKTLEALRESGAITKTIYPQFKAVAAKEG